MTISVMTTSDYISDDYISAVRFCRAHLEEVLARHVPRQAGRPDTLRHIADMRGSATLKWYSISMSHGRQKGAKVDVSARAPRRCHRIAPAAPPRYPLLSRDGGGV